MEPAVEITKLCEAWWERLSNSTKDDHLEYANRFLGLLGWKEAAAIDTAGTEASIAPVSFNLRGGAQSAVAAYFILPGSLEPPTSLTERGLDFCDSTRRLVDHARKTNINYAFITDLFRSYLYDACTDELLLYSDTPEAFNREIADVLNRASVERGGLEEIRRDPRSTAARKLREWCHHWWETLQAETAIDESTALLLIDRLIVFRYMYEHDILNRTGWELRQRYADLVKLASSANPEGCGRALTALFHDIWFDWKAELFHPAPKADEALESDTLSATMLREFSLMSRAKFSVATILESFNYGDASEKARVRLVPENDSERETYLGKQTVDTIDGARVVVDLMEEGYRSIGFWFDRLVAMYAKLGIAFDADPVRTGAVDDSMDLFTWSEFDANRPGALKDHFQHAVEQGLIVHFASDRQYRIARLMLYLHLISRYEQGKQRFTGFPRIEAALQKRPVLSEAEKKWNRRVHGEEIV